MYYANLYSVTMVEQTMQAGKGKCGMSGINAIPQKPTHSIQLGHNLNPQILNENSIDSYR